MIELLRSSLVDIWCRGFNSGTLGHDDCDEAVEEILLELKPMFNNSFESFTKSEVSSILYKVLSEYWPMGSKDKYEKIIEKYIGV